MVKISRELPARGWNRKFSQLGKKQLSLCVEGLGSFFIPILSLEPNQIFNSERSPSHHNSANVKEKKACSHLMSSSIILVFKSLGYYVEELMLKTQKPSLMS